MIRLSDRRKRRSGGFTLLEVLLVLMILIILTSTVSFSVISAQKRAHRRAAEAQMGLFKPMLDNYAFDVGHYPTSDQGLAALRDNMDGSGKWDGPYAESEIPADPWGSPYQYQMSPEGDGYQIWSLGPDGQDGTGDEIYFQR